MGESATVSDVRALPLLNPSAFFKSCFIQTNACGVLYYMHTFE